MFRIKKKQNGEKLFEKYRTMYHPRGGGGLEGVRKKEVFNQNNPSRVKTYVGFCYRSGLSIKYTRSFQVAKISRRVPPCRGGWWETIRHLALQYAPVVYRCILRSRNDIILLWCMYSFYLQASIVLFVVIFFIKTRFTNSVTSV